MTKQTSTLVKTKHSRATAASGLVQGPLKLPQANPTDTIIKGL